MPAPSTKTTRFNPLAGSSWQHHRNADFQSAVSQVFNLHAWILFGIWSIGFGVLLSGCSSSSKGPISSSLTPATIDKVNLLAAPVALNLDGLPGPDTIAVKVYAGAAREAKPVPITTGTLELLAFEGVLKKSTNAPQPLKTWSYSASELRRFQFKTSIGIGYQITASFSEVKPNADKLTILARYLPDPARAIYSSPSTISLTAN